jgi:aspartyl-tRNA(Asn)/glutamyl-tRNA(Gln) amidotransferase subunit A
MDLAFASAAELAAQIRKRAVSPVEVVRGALERIERSQPTLNAFITVAGDKAMAEAHAAEAAVMQDGQLGKLHGVPVAVKDLIPTAGIRTTWGSLIFKDHVPDHDSVAVARLKQAGAIVVGKTTTPEFGQQCLTQAPLFGRTRNAWRADRSSGGSSGGSAVAVAAGLVPIAVATDGGGSTRIPAACNGIVGFKQSDRQSGGQSAMRLRPRRHAAGDSVDCPPWRRCRFAACSGGFRGGTAVGGATAVCLTLSGLIDAPEHRRGSFQHPGHIRAPSRLR